MIELPFKTREAAGRILAGKLQQYAGKKNTLILALVRGGVVVGYGMASILKLPLYPYIVRKIGHPEHREYGLGALAEGGATYIDESFLQGWQSVSWEDVEEVIDEEMKELKRRKEAYAVHPRPSLKGKTVILTDDGIATGGSMIAAIDDLRNAGARKIVVAVPVSPPDTAEVLRKKADEFVVLETPANFDAVGKWYVEFDQVEDDEVIALLKKSENAVPARSLK